MGLGWGVEVGGGVVLGRGVEVEAGRAVALNVSGGLDEIGEASGVAGAETPPVGAAVPDPVVNGVLPCSPGEPAVGVELGIVWPCP